MSKIPAWVLRVENSIHVSVSQMELVHVISNPELHKVPHASDYCNDIVIWNDNMLPVICIASLLNDTSYDERLGFVAVIIYKGQNNAIQYGGIKLSGPPWLESVSNNQMCMLPDAETKINEISLSCFISKDNHTVPILDMNKLFSRSYTESNMASIVGIK